MQWQTPVRGVNRGLALLLGRNLSSSQSTESVEEEKFTPAGPSTPFDRKLD